MKSVDRMTPRERQHLIVALEVDHRTTVVEAAKLQREIRRLVSQLEAKQQRVREIEEGINLLRS